MAVTNPLQNLQIEIQGKTNQVEPGGEPLRRVVTLYNRGIIAADLDLGIEPADERSKAILSWYSFDKSDAELQLSPNGDVTVNLSFTVPPQAEPGYYSYNVVLESPQYPGENARRLQQLQVLAPKREVQRNDPKIFLSPVTDSTNPLVLQPGGELSLTVKVENPSLRTDRFFVACLDLPGDWYSVTYPESEANVPGVVSRTNGLQLNPKESGEISLRFHPPADTLAGNYFPTVKVTSSNRVELMLLEIVYLTIPVDDDLTLKLSPEGRKMPAAEDFFEVYLRNSGNIERTIDLVASDEEHKLNYTITPERLPLPPGEERVVLLRPHPKYFWQKLWRLNDQTITFTVAAENATPVLLAPTPTVEDLSEPVTEQPALPGLATGKIYWKSRRRWLFWLLVALLAIGALTSTVLALWYFLVWRPSLRPQIIELSTSQETYQESVAGNGPGVTLNWDITNLDQVFEIQLFQRAASSTEAPPPQTYRLPLNQNNILIPEELEPYCQRVEAVRSNSLISNLLQFQRRMAKLSPNIPVLQCREVPLAPAINQEGTYRLELQVFPRETTESGKQVAADNPVAIKTLEGVVVDPPPPPAIQSFAAAAIEYSLPTNGAISFVPEPFGDAGAEGDATQPEVSTVPTPQEERPVAPIRLNWEISNLEDIDRLRLMSLAPDGSENTQPVEYDLNNGVLPIELTPYCQTANNLLTCRQVPTTATKVGEYVFYLTVIPVGESTGEDIVESTATIPIKPPLPEIVEFSLNGKPVIENPKQVFVVNPARETLELLLTWTVQDATQVELLPAPGVIEGNSIRYTTSAAPGSEMITLRVVNELGEEKTQTVVVEKVAFEMPGAAGVPGGSPMSPTPADGGMLPPPPAPSVIPLEVMPLPPAEVPPSAN